MCQAHVSINMSHDMDLAYLGPCMGLYVDLDPTYAPVSVPKYERWVCNQVLGSARMENARY